MYFNLARKIMEEVRRIHRLDHNDKPDTVRKVLDTIDICYDVGQRILEHGSTVHVVKFKETSGSNVNSSYQCCIADYVPRVGDGLVFGGMGGDEEELEGEWIIDPWTNITCRFKDFPAAVRSVSRRWEAAFVMIESRWRLKTRPSVLFQLGSLDVQSYFSNYQHYEPSKNRGSFG
jgi:hypothetical protein